MKKQLRLLFIFSCCMASTLMAEEPSGGTLIELSSVGLLTLVLATLNLRSDPQSKLSKFLRCFSKR